MFHKTLIFVLFASGMVLAQFRTASLSRTIVDEAEMPLGGVGIKVTFLTPSRDFGGRHSFGKFGHERGRQLQGAQFAVGKLPGRSFPSRLRDQLPVGTPENQRR